MLGARSMGHSRRAVAPWAVGVVLHSRQPGAGAMCLVTRLPLPHPCMGFVFWLGMVVLPRGESKHRMM